MTGSRIAESKLVRVRTIFYTGALFCLFDSDHKEAASFAHGLRYCWFTMDKGTGKVRPRPLLSHAHFRPHPLFSHAHFRPRRLLENSC